MTVPHERPGRRVRLYHQLRTAHLERAVQLPPATIVYGARRYDFDDRLTARLDLVQTSGLGAAWWMCTHDVTTLEVNEPLYRQSVRRTAVALTGLRAGQLVRRGPRPQVVCYAIENLDPSELPPPTTRRARLARRVDARLASLVWHRVDRVAFGTEASAHLYGRVLPRRVGRATQVVPALPAAQVRPDEVSKTPGAMLFLGAFDDRKGVRQVLAAWPSVRSARAAGRLLVLGKGPLEGLVRARAVADPTIEVEVDPSRERIREALEDSQVLVLPAQPTPGWREQVGLPIVEGLSYGCTVVCTAETGLASWLRQHGHHVLEDPLSEDSLVAALVRALRHPLPVAHVLASLPAQDGRLVADAWLFERPATR